MAIWSCSHCGAVRDSRCKPQKCQECGEKGTFVKKEVGEAESLECGQTSS